MLLSRLLFAHTLLHFEPRRTSASSTNRHPPRHTFTSVGFTATAARRSRRPVSAATAPRQLFTTPSLGTYTSRPFARRHFHAVWCRIVAAKLQVCPRLSDVPHRHVSALLSSKRLANSNAVLQSCFGRFSSFSRFLACTLSVTSR